MLNWLADRCELTLATIVFGEEDRALLDSAVPKRVEVLCGRPKTGHLTRKLPLALQWCWSQQLAHSIEAAHRKRPFQAAVVSHSYAYLYTEELGDLVRVVDAQNIESRLYRQFSTLSSSDRRRDRHLAGRNAGAGFIGAARTADRIAALERDSWRKADAVLCVSEREQDQIAMVTGFDKTLYVPNCPSRRTPAPAQHESLSTPTVSFAGSLHYMPNIDAVAVLADQVVPRLRSLVPDVRVVVAGREPSPSLIRFCSDKGIDLVADPIDMEGVVAGSVAACPIRLAGGTRLKILDSRSQELPVVATTLAVEGLQIEDDPGIAVCDDMDDFADALAGFLRSGSPPRAPLSFTSWGEVFEPLEGLLAPLGFPAP